MNENLMHSAGPWAIPAATLPNCLLNKLTLSASMCLSESGHRTDLELASDHGSHFEHHGTQPCGLWWLLPIRPGTWGK